jgi:hypothetical protein
VKTRLSYALTQQLFLALSGNFKHVASLGISFLVPIFTFKIKWFRGSKPMRFAMYMRNLGFESRSGWSGTGLWEPLSNCVNISGIVSEVAGQGKRPVGAFTAPLYVTTFLPLIPPWASTPTCATGPATGIKG